MPLKALLREAIRTASDPIAVFARVVEQCLTLVPRADGASLELRRDGGTLEYVAASGTLAPFVGLQLDISASLSGLCVLTGEVQSCSDARSDPRVSASAVAATGVVSMLCVPLMAQGESIATLKVSSREANAFTDADIEILDRLAHFVAVTLRAASEIAQATTAVIDGGDPAATSIEAARFVANITTPGLADDVDAHDLISTLLARDGLQMHVQPLVRLGSREVIAVEALARFSGHPGHSPDWWFDTAHRVGLGVELELQAVRTALALFPQLPDHLRMSVNVGPVTMQHPEFIAAVRGAPMERLTIELTEHAELSDYSGVLDVRNLLRRLEVRFAMDDTGTGFSGLSRLRRLLPDFVKIDRDLVIDVHKDPVRQALCTALTDFAARIDAIVVAEGVENEAEASMLTSLGVERGQGFLFGRPMPVAQLRQMLGIG